MWGAHVYFASPAGSMCPEINGSVATHTKANIGGFEGRPLAAGDEVRLKDCTRDTIICDYTRESNHLFNTVLFNQGAAVNATNRYALYWARKLRTLQKRVSVIFSSELYTLTIQCDRMGFRLDGAPVEHIDGADIISDGAVFGSIQVPSDGNPIILMADRQTTGAILKSVLLLLPICLELSQLPIGDGITFDIVSVEEAQRDV